MSNLRFSGGEKGIRTPGGVAPTTVFKTAAFDHSAISPSEILPQQYKDKQGLNSALQKIKKKTNRIKNKLEKINQ